MRCCGLASWWAGWACGSQGGYGYMVFLVILGVGFYGSRTEPSAVMVQSGL